MICISSLGCVSDDPRGHGSQANSSSTTPIRGESDATVTDASQRTPLDHSIDSDIFRLRDMSVNLDATLIDAAMDQTVMVEPDLDVDPCADELCSGHGTCIVTSDQQARCECDARYFAQGLACVPEDLDGDGHDFTSDCNDDLNTIYPGASELCDHNDTDCDERIDEGACDIWVLRPETRGWERYPLNVGGDQNVPQETIKAAWDIESLGFAFVLTETSVYTLDIEPLTWGAPQARDEIFTGWSGPITGRAYAYSIPASHTSSLSERVTIAIVNEMGAQILWQLKYYINRNTFARQSNTSYYGDEHQWDDSNAPTADQIRAAWLDTTHTQGWYNINPQRLCDANSTSSPVYLSYLTPTSLYPLESGYCFVFTPPLMILDSPLNRPGAPNFSEVGAGFWHQNTLYLFRGD